MAKEKLPRVDYAAVELDGVRYVILREPIFHMLCEKAKYSPRANSTDGSNPTTLDLDRSSLARKIARRRRASGLSQAELARRAGVRPETLNRIERGKTTPDFSTIRKLIVAINAAELGAVAPSSLPSNKKEP